VELVSAVRAAFHGETRISQRELQRVVSALRTDTRHGRAADLTEREQQVLACMTEGLSNRQVADRLGLSTNTVRNHVQRILYKLNVHSRLEAVVMGTGHGLLASGP
jgi:DNA-binding NarL/FixJ family response regulator